MSVVDSLSFVYLSLLKSGRSYQKWAVRNDVVAPVDSVAPRVDGTVSTPALPLPCAREHRTQEKRMQQGEMDMPSQSPESPLQEDRQVEIVC